MFKFWHLLGRLGLFHTDGILAMAPAWWPRARVAYWDVANYLGGTYPMPIGNAVSHAESTGGVVVPVDYDPEFGRPNNRIDSGKA